RFASTATVEDWDGPVRVTRAGRRASLARFEVCPRLPNLLAALARQGIDVLHLHVPNPTMLLALAAVRPRAPVVITYHSDVVRQKRLAKLVRPFEHLVFGRAAAILVTSPAYPAGSEILRAYAGKVTTLPFGIDLGPYLDPSTAVLAQARRL